MISRLHVKFILLSAALSPLFFTSKAMAFEEPVAGISVALEAYYEEQAAKIYDVSLSSELQDYTYDLCKEYGVNFDLAIAIMDGESEYDIMAFGVNDNGSTDSGLMQINSCNHEWLEEELGITDFFDPKQNILCGVFMLADLMERHDDVHEILICYNMGERTMRKLRKKGIYTTEYSRKVVSKMKKLRKEGIKL